jgi:hypothetical protein
VCALVLSIFLMSFCVICRLVNSLFPSEWFEAVGILAFYFSMLVSGHSKTATDTANQLRGPAVREHGTNAAPET